MNQFIDKKMSTQDFKNKNTIAYDISLRSKLGQLHDMLGVEITDVAVGAMEYGSKFSPETKDILKTLSSVTSDLSVVLMEAKGSKKELSPSEKEDFDNVKSLIEYLGNLQFKLNKIIQKVSEFNTVAQEMKDLGMDCAEYTMTAEKQFKTVRARINDLDYLSADPSIAHTFKKEEIEENN